MSSKLISFGVIFLLVGVVVFALVLYNMPQGDAVTQASGVVSPHGSSMSAASNVHPDVIHQIAVLKSAVKKDPKNVAHLSMLAAALIDANRHAEAIPYLERANVIVPKDESVLLNLSVCYAQTGRYDQAMDATNRLLRYHPSQTTALYNKGALYATMGKNEEAVRWWKKLIALAPGTDDAKKASAGLTQLGNR
jgi:tetratricopeptide (TPR) repeat protein